MRFSSLSALFWQKERNCQLLRRLRVQPGAMLVGTALGLKARLLGKHQWQQQTLKKGLILPLPPSESDRRS
ncbi:MAG: hypothetical protein LRZ84_03250 [Desertifilum sp.]|nr:hypothetical protein [Desertifilum sp.]